jgi:hypothetical protein
MKPERVRNMIWRNSITGARASLFGARPAGDGWNIVTEGETIRWPDGTIGLPFNIRGQHHNPKAIDAAIARAIESGFRGFRGMSL